MVYAPLSSHIQDELLSNLMVAVIERFTAWREEPLSLRAAARRNAGDWRIRRTIARVRAEPGAMLGTEALAREGASPAPSSTTACSSNPPGPRRMSS